MGEVFVKVLESKFVSLIWLLLGGFVLSGCVLAPGMNMDRSHYSVMDSDSVDYREGVEIQRIDAALIAKELSALRDRTTQEKVLELTADKSAYEYKISPLDVLQVTVWDHPELTTPSGQFRTAADSGNLVRKDGTVFYPYVGVVEVAGKTMDQVRIELTKKLSLFIENPQVDVRIAAYRGQTAYVTGQVNKPGALVLTDQHLTVFDAIAQVGGFMVDADMEHTVLIRDGHTYNLDLFSLYSRGQSGLNLLLQDGDVLNIPDNQLNKVFVLGKVAKPSSLTVKNGKLTLAEAISDTGGFGTWANPEQVYVVRSNREYGDKEQVASAAVDRFNKLAKLEIFHLDSSSPEALLLADQFHLQARDVVYVSETELSRFSNVFSDLAQIINTSAQTVILQRSITR